MSTVVYARVPEALKAAADDYAGDHGVTLTAAVVDLLERGLAAASDENSVSDLQQKLATTRAEVTELRSQVAALDVLRQRRGQVLGKCPKCETAVTAYQLFVAGSCHECHEGLANMLVPTTTSAGVDRTEMLLLLGVVAGVVGAAWIASKST